MLVSPRCQSHCPTWGLRQRLSKAGAGRKADHRGWLGCLCSREFQPDSTPVTWEMGITTSHYAPGHHSRSQQVTGSKTRPVGLSRASSRKLQPSAVLIQRKKKGRWWLEMITARSRLREESPLVSPQVLTPLQKPQLSMGAAGKHLWDRLSLLSYFWELKKLRISLS